MKTHATKTIAYLGRQVICLCGIATILLVVLPGVGRAGFSVTYPPAQTVLDGQDVDWITITDNSAGVSGLGILLGGTLKVGVEPVNAGDFTIEEGSTFNADQIGAGTYGTEQYTGTINLGGTLIIKTGGKVYLNQDTLNALGRSDADYDDSLRMSGGSLLDSYNSDLAFKHNVKVGDNSTMKLEEGTFTFGDKVYVRDSSTVTITGVTASHQDLSDPDNDARVVVESQSTLNLINSSLDLVSGGGNSSDGQNILIKSGGNVLATGSNITARLVSSDNSGSLYSQTGGSLNTHGLTSADSGEIVLDTTTVNSDYVSVNGKLTATATTLNLTGDNFSGTDGTTLLTNSTLNITGGGDIDLMGASKFTTENTDISADMFLMRHTAEAKLSSSTGAVLDINHFKSIGTNTIDITGYDVNIANLFDIGVEGGTGTQMNLTSSTLNALDARILNNSAMTAADSGIFFENGGVINNSTLTLTDTSSLSFEDELFIDNSGSVSLNNSSLTHQNDTDSTDDSRGSVIVNNSGSLNLNASTIDLSTGNVQQIKIESGSSLTAVNSSNIIAKDLRVENFGSLYSQTDGSFDLAGLFATDSGEIQLDTVTATAESVSVTSDSSLTAASSTLTVQDEVNVNNNASMTLNGGTFTFGDRMYVRDSGTVTMTGVAASHQDLSDPDNVARVIVENQSTMNLTNSSLDLVSGGGDSSDGQNILIKSEGKVLATDTSITARLVSSDNSGSLYSQTGGSLNTHGLTSADSGEIVLDTTTVNSDYVSVNGKLTATATTLNLTGDNFSGTDGTTLLTNSALNITGGGDIDLMGASKFTAENTDISADVFLARDNAETALSSSTNSELNVRIFKSTGANTIDVTGYDANIAELFDIGVDGGAGGAQLSFTGSTLDAEDARILNSASMTVDDSDLTSRGDGTINNAALTLLNNSSLAFEDELFIEDSGMVSVTNGAITHQNDADATDDSRGSIIARGGGSLNLNNSTVDLSSGDEQKINIYTEGTVTADQSTITAKQVVIKDSNSTMEISKTTLTTESLNVSDGASFIANDSTVHITGNTTTVESGGSLFINGGSYSENGDFIVAGGSLNAVNAAITVGGDMSVTGDAIVSVDELFIGDDFLFTPVGTGSFSMDSTMITMLGTSDDEGDGHTFTMDSSILLGGLNIAESVSLVLKQSLTVTDLSFLGTGFIDLNGYNLTVSSLISGTIDQIITTNGGRLIYDPSQSVPEPSMLLLMGMGVLFLSKTRREK